MTHLRRLLERSAAELPDAGKLIVTDGVFSMSGVIANVPELVSLAEEFDAALMLDDAHAVGVIGTGGNGSADHFGLSDRVHMKAGPLYIRFAWLAGLVLCHATSFNFIWL